MEQALLVHVRLKDPAYRDSWPAEEAAQELRELVRSSGVSLQEEVRVERGRPTPDTLIGKGKVEELHALCHTLQPQVVIFGHDLNFPQQRNLEDRLDVKVIDRTQLILDIFAQRARSQEGKVQVELAQLGYLLPRLAGKGILLSRLGGGIGTRGPGEQKLEIDRRRIRTRITRLKSELAQIGRRRGVARRKRDEEEVPTVSLIGYTNAGKSTLLNALTQAGAAAEDRLFTTLDPLTRRLTLGSRQPALLSDTVGFLHLLPHHLIEAFRATLEEVTQSDLLLHVVDASDPLVEKKIEAVYEVLRLLEADQKTSLLVLNKRDRLSAASLAAISRRQPGAVAVSARTGEGLPVLLDRLSGLLTPRMREAVVWMEPKALGWLKRLYSHGQVLSRRDLPDGVELKVRVPHRLYGQLSKEGLLRSS